MRAAPVEVEEVVGAVEGAPGPSAMAWWATASSSREASTAL
jgi:hypothetical protein